MRMKGVTGLILLAVLFFAGAFVASRLANETRDLAAAHERLAVLQYDTTEALDDASAPAATSRWRIRALDTESRRHRAEVTYWLGRYAALTPLIDGTATETDKDPAVMFVAANAKFRSTRLDGTDRKAMVERLDSVMQAYAEVLRADPSIVDAAFNYEYVGKQRDMIAKGTPRLKPEKDPTEKLAMDLPPGATVHGRHGAPPVTMSMDEFKTISPMRFDEREDQAQPGRGGVQKRRG
jgi:hypothetical protein